MTADYVDAVRHHRFDLLYARDQLAALIDTIPEPDHLLIENWRSPRRSNGKDLAGD